MAGASGKGSGVWEVRSGAAAGRDDAGLVELVALARGRTLQAVRYVAPQYGAWPQEHRQDRVHEVDMDIEMIMADRSRLRLYWDMDGFNEGLAIEFRSPDEAKAEFPGPVVDVSDHVDWRPYIEVSMADIQTAWHVPHTGCAEMPWAYHVLFGDELSVAIFLGEDAGSGLSYMPDNLVVFFDEEPARSYASSAGGASFYE